MKKDQDHLHDLYSERKARFEDLLKKQKKVLAYISVLRLAAIVLAVYFMVSAVKNEVQVLWLVSGLMVILFFVLVSYYKNQNDRRKLLIELVRLNEREIKCLENDFGDHPDGSRFRDPAHPWSFDLDLFGEGSIYQFINRTSTHTGQETLASYLREPVSDPDKISGRQDITKELVPGLDLRQFYIANAHLMESESGDYEEFIRWSGEPVYIEKLKWTKAVAYVVSVLTLLILTAGIIDAFYFRLLLPVILINLGILAPFFQRTNRYQALISKKHKFLKTYSVLLDILAREEFVHPELRNMKERCRSASVSISKLSFLLDLFDQRLNLLVGFVLNIFFLFDFFMLHRLAGWSRRYREDLPVWLGLAGQCDALFSLAGFAFNHPAYCYPQIRAEYRGIRSEGMGHPMIPADRRVDNSIEIRDEKVILITGANMAGKSTFLRSLGINMVLSYAGCPVCADEFITGPYVLYSSMRTSDSLKDDESYFFAEIKRLKRIVDEMEKGTLLMILLDEVLKGTNTTDKQKGSRGLIEKSVRHEVLCFIATHDLALGTMQEEHPGQVVNYCFESYIRDLDLTFDYRIQPGLAKNMNASFLMKKMGIMD